APGAPDARAPRGVPADVRGGGLRPLARGVRGHPPHEQEFEEPPPWCALLAPPGRVTPSRLWRTSPRVRQDGPPAAGSPRTARSQLPHPPDRLLRRVLRRWPALCP